jgi:beta-phosphoglucomutase-like phosphatase (HAD superfamily)
MARKPVPMWTVPVDRPAEDVADLHGTAIRTPAVQPQRPKVILTDIDGTLLNFDAAFESWMRRQGFPKHVQTSDQYALGPSYRMTEVRILALLAQFFDETHAARMEPLPCAAEIVPRLHREGWKFVAISASPNSRAVISRRRENLRAAFGFDFAAVWHLGFKANKMPMLRSFTRSVWVEDHLDHALAGWKVGHRTFLLDRPYNSDRSPNVRFVGRVPDWHAIGQALLTAQETPA